MSTLPETTSTTGKGPWENEGGALAPHSSSELPDGITAIPVTHYRVGNYTYTNLRDAMAEYQRQAPGD
ncbi:hypothetical protein [Croceicoccus pelagius]|uniref:Uncharacterized protein n=1 Tax=Croceicoccus pelagius TaxID=1703341 RepID=A0A916YHQ7_9SPHN|nr:hypothetical protein [Croceicoccus pelagius]GGD44630.1 hypothetical protein GCM10010989_18420 [Croceicoccus pelagius]